MSQIDLLRRHYLDAITSERWTASDWNRWTPQVRYAWTASLESAARAHAMSFHGFEWRADPGGQQYRRRLAIGQIPVLYNERQNECDQEKIEEIEHVADCRRGEHLPLIDGEFL